MNSSIYFTIIEHLSMCLLLPIRCESCSLRGQEETLMASVPSYLLNIKAETDSLFYLNDHFIDNTLTHCLEVIETRVREQSNNQKSQGTRG